MKTTLIIMAAGLGSRFGTGIKQLAKMGQNDELIMDYSIYDAKEAGFDKFVIVIRKDIEAEFMQVIGKRIAQYADVEYVYQELGNLPDGFAVPENRIKPWGTGQAVLCCKNVVREPFAVINADDYYGKQAFKLLHDYLVTAPKEADCLHIGMVGFLLANTLSENGTVTRGISIVDDNNMLTDIYETSGIRYQDGNLQCDNVFVQSFLNEANLVSMNMWAASPKFLGYLEEDFPRFLNELGDDKLKKEYLLPIIIGDLLKRKKALVKVMRTSDKWIGITYKEDIDKAQTQFKKMIENGEYKQNLWSNNNVKYDD